ncbi:MAG: peptide deformylase, partial [Comamonadaceae bacterium]|nr:peptide deformylase [Comamonadaceae bacterium]
ETSGEPETSEEGCLSLPGISVPVTRKPWARVRYFDLDGNECEIEGDGLLGRCLQHEIDHLDGRTLFESCNPIDRIKALREYEQALAAGARPGDTGIN